MARYTKAAQAQVKFYKKLDAALKANAPTKSKRPSRSKSFALPVEGSTCLAEGYYNARTKELAFKFVKGGLQYVYSDVPRSVAVQVQSGEDFNDLIKGEYDYA